LLYCKFWWEHLFKISRELFFWKIPREFLLFFKRRAKRTKRGPGPLLRKKGAPTVFLRYRYGKYREIPTDTDRKIPIRDTTLDFSSVFCSRLWKNTV
jgi:hypothetical protein